MKILHVTNYDNLGGAGIAAYRLHTALRKEGIDSRMLVRRKGTNDSTVEEVGSFTPVDSCSLVVDKDEEKKPQQPIIQQLNNCRARLMIRARGWLGAKLTNALGMEGDSLNVFPTGLHRVLNASDADVIHLHWINNEMISVKEIAKITKPIVWTLHDCWPFLGAEHHSDADYWQAEDGGRPEESGSPLRFEKSEVRSQALTTSNEQPATRVALHDAVNNWIFRKKLRSWKRLQISFIAPSNWMAEQVQQSKLFSDAPVTVIPNYLDMEVFQSLEQLECRRKLNLPLDKRLILFGANNPMDTNKGLDLLEDALQKLPEDVRRGLGVVVFGLRPIGAYAPEGCDGERSIGGLEAFWLGGVSNDWKMAEIYNAVDCTCVPSRIETLPNVIAESMACGTPCVGFQVGGIPDLIEHQKNGYLAQSYNTESFATGIQWVLTKVLADTVRLKAEGMFSERVVSGKHITIYKTF